MIFDRTPSRIALFICTDFCQIQMKSRIQFSDISRPLLDNYSMVEIEPIGQNVSLCQKSPSVMIA